MSKKKTYQLPTLIMQAGDSGAVAVVDVTGVIGWDDAQCLEFADKLKPQPARARPASPCA